MPTDTEIAMLESRFDKIATIEFGGHSMVFQRPTYEHALMYRKARDANDPARLDNLCLFTIVAFDNVVAPEPKDREPLRVAFKAVLAKYPMACDSEVFQVPFANLLGVTEDGIEGKGWRVSSKPLET